MKQNRIQTRLAKLPRPDNTTNTTRPGDDRIITAPPGNGMLRWIALASIVTACGGFAALLPHLKWKDDFRSAVPGKVARLFEKPKPWEPRTKEDYVIDQFVKRRRSRDMAALDLLGPAPQFDDRPVSEKTAAAMQTDLFLRADLRIVDVLRGEPDGNGKQIAKPGCYTLVTKGSVSAPKLSIRTNKGIEPPSQLMMANPDLVVEVRDGKIRGLRPELHMGP